LATLQLLVGDAEVTSVLRHPEFFEGDATGVLELTAEFLADPEEDAVEDEVRQLFEILVFNEAELEEMAGIGSPTASLVDFYASAPPAELGGCSAFFYNGTSLPAGIGPCLEFQTANVGDRYYRVFYPAPSMPAAGWTTTHYRWALEAMVDTVMVYDMLGMTPSVNLVFSIFPGDALAVALARAGEPCPVAVYTRMQRLSEGQFKQVVAHELAHCFSAETFTPQNEVSYEFRKWREEGLADYLSNVVYEDVNYEWAYDSLEALELHTTLFDRVYTNSFFFQFLGQNIGDPSIMNLVHGLPDSGGRTEQENGLASYPDIANIYHEFAQAVSDESVIDTSGAPVPFAPQANQNTISGPIIFDSLPQRFGVTRLHLVIDPGKVACLEHETSGGIQATWRTGRPGKAGAGGWSDDLPSTLEGEAIFLSTATSASQLLTSEVTKVVDTLEDCEEDEGAGRGDGECPQLCQSEFYRFLSQLPGFLADALE
jgi:hypothetical protein